MSDMNGAGDGRQLLAGRRALIFGGGSGIGLGAARCLMVDGADVWLAGRDVQRLDGAVRQLEADAPEGVAVGRLSCDATEEDSVASVVRSVLDGGDLDICVNSVGGSTIVPLLLCSAEQFKADVDRNLLSTFLTLKHSAVAMAASGGGSYVAVSSDAAKLSFPYVGPYCAGKAAVDALIRVAADELAGTGVRFNAIRPGLIRTERNAHLTDDEDVHRTFVAEKPLGRLGTVEDVGAAIRYLAGPESSFVTGQSFAVDGGNELRRAPSLEDVARRRYGDRAVDAALCGDGPVLRDLAPM
jgi:NAD(P)-dependent dehydrogenase (short-subunit alcohol dehydrogenase family)